MIPFLKWFSKSTTPEPAPKPIVQGIETLAAHVDMDMVRWKANPMRVDYAKALFQDRMFLEMFAAVDNFRFTSARPGITDTEAQILLGMTLGYNKCLANFKSLAEEHQKIEPVPQDYSDDLAKQFPIKPQ